MPYNFEASSLWRSTLATVDNDIYSTQRERLCTAYLGLREKIIPLCNRIFSSFNELTIHDVTHLDALWETASLIAGLDYKLTPLEGFVLGCSFLLHDSALSYEAFDIAQLRGTPEWKDSYAFEHDVNPLLSSEQKEHNADFATIRILHSKQAKYLLMRVLPTSIVGTPDVFLLDDHELRTHLGELIGDIAESHNWDIEEVERKFTAQRNVPAGFPSEWRIQPLKLACLLRCADVLHIDSCRAPDYLLALFKRNNISQAHWVAQNHLSKADIDTRDSNGETVIITSDMAFAESESDAWFVAYDAISLANKEIIQCNKLLLAKNMNQFKVKRITGVESPTALSECVKAEKWKPSSHELHISNIQDLINNLGGENLYGKSSDLLRVALRELIQNSRDAVKARKQFEESYVPKIAISFMHDGEDIWLEITDNGIGMSERVLTDVLLDFGQSYWASSLASKEYPGLRSSKFESVGQYGIGFYSIFMIASEVYITSRQYTAALGDALTLKFPNGLSLRPIITNINPNDYKVSISTLIHAKLKKDIIPADGMILMKTNLVGAVNFTVPIEKYVAAVVAGLDTDIYMKTDTNTEIRIHEDVNSPTFDALQWIKDISFSEYQTTVQDKLDYITSNITRLRPIIENGIRKGFAAITTRLGNTNDFLSAKTIGGLTNDIHNRNSEKYIGYIDFFPSSANRNDGEKYSASEQSVLDWATEQLNIIKSLSLSPAEKFVAASAMCQFKVDPTEIAQIFYYNSGQVYFSDLSYLADLSLNHRILFRVTPIFLNTHMSTFGGIDFSKHQMMK